MVLEANEPFQLVIDHLDVQLHRNGLLKRNSPVVLRMVQLQFPVPTILMHGDVRASGSVPHLALP